MTPIIYRKLLTLYPHLLNWETYQLIYFLKIQLFEIVVDSDVVVRNDTERYDMPCSPDTNVL